MRDFWEGHQVNEKWKKLAWKLFKALLLTWLIFEILKNLVGCVSGFIAFTGPY
jgi:hypothetical protein